MCRFSFRNTRLYRDILVLFRFFAVRSPYIVQQLSLRGRRRHKIQCQLRQCLVAGLAIQPELYGTLCLKWTSVLELCGCSSELASVSCIKACKSMQIRMQALPLRARISLPNWYVPITIANATQFAVRQVA